MLIRNESDQTLIFKSAEAPDNARIPLHRAHTAVKTEEGQVQLQQQVFEGTHLFFVHAELHTPLQTRWNCTDEKKLLLLNLEGEAGIRAGGKKEKLFTRLQYNTISGQVKSFRMTLRGNRQRFLLLLLDKKSISGLAKEIRRALIAEVSGWKLPENGRLSLAMTSLAENMAGCRLDGEKGKLFLRGQLYALLALLADVQEQHAKTVYRYCKTDYDMERISFAREYLLRHYDLPPTLKELSRIIGMNEYKLKRAFREVYGNSVFGYLTDYKMELARKELETGQRTASELAYDLGYSSLQHFSKVFRKKFGFPPGAFKK
ncbi:MAG: AraC family transcriptional regulator [Bacteroidetes bacterium]|nr:MAG: AraC family transcriptional regulator [Bacteroidota bacterium]